MHDLDDVLESCFAELSKEYEIEKVTYVPHAGQKSEVKVPVWRMLIQAGYKGTSTDVEIFIAFPSGFPYEMPMVVINDGRFRYLPHISPDDGKICLYEDGMSYNAANVIGIIRDNISKTRRWIELYAENDNTRESTLL